MRPKPKLHDYQTLEAYLEDLVDWKIEDAYDKFWMRDLGIDPEINPKGTH